MYMAFLKLLLFAQNCVCLCVCRVNMTKGLKKGYIIFNFVGLLKWKFIIHDFYLWIFNIGFRVMVIFHGII